LIDMERGLAQTRLPQVAKGLVRDQRLIVIVLFLLGLGPRLWDIGRRSFWLDELNSLAVAAQSFDGVRLALSDDANMTLYFWALFVWLAVVGVAADEGTIRLLSALLGAAAVPLIYLLGRRLHSTAAGLSAAALLTVNAYHLLMSQEARSYGAFGSFTVLSYLALDRSIELGRRRDWVLHGVVTALAFYLHFYTVFVIFAQALFVLTRRSRAAMVGFAWSGLTFVLLTVQLAPYIIGESRARLTHVQQPGLSDVGRFFRDYSGGSDATLAVYVALTALGLALAGKNARDATYRNSLLLTWFVVPVGLAIGLSLARPMFKDRYLLATLPALTLLAGVGIAQLPRLAAGLVLCTVPVLSIMILRDGFEVHRHEQWRQAVSYALSQAEPGDGWIFISKFGQHGFEYYGRWGWGRNPSAPYHDVFEPFDYRTALAVPNYFGVVSMQELEPYSRAHPRIWLVLSHETESIGGANLAAPVRNWLARHGYSVVQQRQYQRVRLLLYHAGSRTETL
jgi:hypothetical protein